MSVVYNIPTIPCYSTSHDRKFVIAFSNTATMFEYRDTRLHFQVRLNWLNGITTLLLLSAHSKHFFSLWIHWVWYCPLADCSASRMGDMLIRLKLLKKTKIRELLRCVNIITHKVAVEPCVSRYSWKEHELSKMVDSEQYFPDVHHFLVVLAYLLLLLFGHLVAKRSAISVKWWL